MRIAPVAAVLVVCLLAPAAPGQAQAPGTPPPGETQASPAAARVVGRVLSLLMSRNDAQPYRPRSEEFVDSGGAG